jgi:hypothetical protein
MGLLNILVKCGGSVIAGSDPILLFDCFSMSILNLVRVFSMAFTSSTFAVGLVFISVNAVTFLTSMAFTFTLLKFCDWCWQYFLSLLSLSIIFTFAFLFSILLLKFCVRCWQHFLSLLSLPLLLFEERFPRVEFSVLLRLLIFRNRVCEDVESFFQCADCLERER